MLEYTTDTTKYTTTPCVVYWLLSNCESIDLIGSSASIPPVSEPGARWSVEETLLLLDEYKQRKASFDGEKGAVVHDNLYSEISASMTQYKVYKSAAQCRAKKEALDDEFRQRYDLAESTGQAPPDWRFYTIMLELEGKDNPGLKPPYSFSAGLTSSYKVCSYYISYRSVLVLQNEAQTSKKREKL